MGKSKAGTSGSQVGKKRTFKKEKAKKYGGSDKKKNKKKRAKLSYQKKVGFERGLKAENIVGIAQSKDGHQFLMKWKGTNKTDWVPSKEVNVNCPQMVIAFYQSRITWRCPQGHYH